MLTATQTPVRFATVVGVAPSTTTMRLGDATPAIRPVERSDALSMRQARTGGLMPPIRPVTPPTVPTAPVKPAPQKAPPAPPRQRRRYYMPYASLEDLRSANGLGIINEGDAWLTGRPYGLPGTATIRLSQSHGGYHNPNGYHYDASMVGGGFGGLSDADATLQLILAQQQAQSASLKRIAFWQGFSGAFAIGTLAATVAVGAVAYMRRRR